MGAATSRNHRIRATSTQPRERTNGRTDGRNDARSMRRYAGGGMATASGAPTAAASASASASARRRRAVTRPSVKTHRGHRRGLRNHAAAPATPTSSKAVTREECYEFVRSGCKPKESFRCGRDAMVMRCARDARCARRGRDARRRGFVSGVSTRLRLGSKTRRTSVGRSQPETWMRGGGRENAPIRA